MGQLWVYVSLLSAIGDALRDFSAKRSLTEVDSILFAWLIFAIPLPIIYLADFICGVPKPAPGFYSAIFTALPLEILAQILYMRALRLSPLGLVAPLLSLTPVFMLVIPYLLIGEKIGLTGGAGVLMIAAGAWVLNAGTARKSILEPFRVLLRDQGAVCMCAVALLFSFTATLSKKAIALSSPAHYMAVYWTFLIIGMSPIVLLTHRGRLREVISGGAVGKALLPALIFVTAVFAAAYAMSLTKVTYVNTVKRLSALFSILLAGAFLKEESIRERFSGAALMASGFALIVLFG